MKCINQHRLKQTNKTDRDQQEPQQARIGTYGYPWKMKRSTPKPTKIPVARTEDRSKRKQRVGPGTGRTGDGGKFLNGPTANDDRDNQ